MNADRLKNKIARIKLAMEKGIRSEESGNKEIAKIQAMLDNPETVAKTESKSYDVEPANGAFFLIEWENGTTSLYRRGLNGQYSSSVFGTNMATYLIEAGLLVNVEKLEKYPCEAEFWADHVAKKQEKAESKAKKTDKSTINWG